MHLLISIISLPGKIVELTFGSELVACAFGTALHRNRSFTCDQQAGRAVQPPEFLRFVPHVPSEPKPSPHSHPQIRCPGMARIVGMNPSPLFNLNMGPLQAVRVCSSPLVTNHTFRWKQELVIHKRQSVGGFIMSSLGSAILPHAVDAGTSCLARWSSCIDNYIKGKRI